MGTDLLRQYSDAIIGASEHEIRSDPTLNGRLVFSSEGKLSISYAPFDYITPRAKVVIVGITPGAQQAANALAETRRQLLAGITAEAALKAPKSLRAFPVQCGPTLSQCSITLV